MTAPDPTAGEEPREWWEEYTGDRYWLAPASPPAVAASTGGEHVIEERGRVYDRCRCGWYGSLGDTHVAASMGTSEDVEALVEALTYDEPKPLDDQFHEGCREIARAVLASDWLAAREAAARAEGYRRGISDRGQS